MARSRRRNKRPPTRRKPQHVLEGVIQISRRGEGFVETAEGSFRIPRKGVGPAMNGDTVAVVRTNTFGPGYKAYVHSVVQRATQTVVGRYETDGVLRVVIPFDERIQHDFFLEPHDGSPEQLGIVDEDVVLARIVQYPTRQSAGIATLEQRIGASDDRDLTIEQIIASHGFSTHFSDAALKEARALTMNDNDVPDRLDMTDLIVVTIDPEDARDFDDALSCEVVDDKTWRVGVHIADVSHFVASHSSLDIEARKRSTSVYLVDRVIPMLPEELSCELCSLKPEVDRFAFSVFMDVSVEGEIQGYEIFSTKIHSRRRFTYDEVDALLVQAQGVLQKSGSSVQTKVQTGELQPSAPQAGVLPAGALHHDADRPSAGAATPVSPEMHDLLMRLNQVAQGRLRIRQARGSLDFETTEAKVVLDETGVPQGVKVRKRTPATSLVEEAMLMANECVAHYLDSHDKPAAFRVHDRPSEDALLDIVSLIAEFGHDWEITDTERLVAGVVAGVPHALQTVLDASRGRPEEYLVHNTVLRSMKRAEYAPFDTGHYGLGTSQYCHFTSPIRRYPDLIVHRALKNTLSEADAAQLALLCQHASEQERAADAASAESQRSKLVEYMGNFIGQVFSGVITSVQPYGVFVRMDETTAWGLVPVKHFGDEWFEYNDEKRIFVGEVSQTVLRAGRAVEVRIKSVDVSAGHITCEFADIRSMMNNDEI